MSINFKNIISIRYIFSFNRLFQTFTCIYIFFYVYIFGLLFHYYNHNYIYIYIYILVKYCFIVIFKNSFLQVETSTTAPNLPADSYADHCSESEGNHDAPASHATKAYKRERMLDKREAAR